MEMNEADKKALHARIDERNAVALAENLTDLRIEYDRRITAMENDIASLKHLVQSQSRVIGETLQAVMGRGSTVADPHPEDER